MTVVDSLMAIAEWLNENPCKRFEFKVPPEDQRKPINDDYEYKRVHPHAFPVYIPTKDMLPPNIISNMPSLCVQLVQGEDDNALLQRELRINIGISCWNPGIHAGDMYYSKNMEPTEQVKYKNGYDGWMDAWNFVDDILRRLGSINNIGNLEILKSHQNTGHWCEIEHDQIQQNRNEQQVENPVLLEIMSPGAGLCQRPCFFLFLLLNNHH